MSASLARCRGVLADPARIVVCSGFSHALCVLASALRDLGSTEMAFEDPAFDRHVRRCRTEYRARRDRLVAALPHHLAPRGISAGLHLVLPLPASAEAEVPAAARRRSLEIAILSEQRIRPDPETGGLVVGYGASSKAAFGGALQSLLDVLREVPRE
ncbi:MAG: hypothetical protein H0V92_09650 [Pseudonocardiales bacterium]|nr:hypothetical protein [Pseudonocardiales bacterium]